MLFCVLDSSTAYAQNRFKNVEIRVIRPKFFAKRNKLELGAEMTGVMNETFIYTFLATGLATYHFSETWALEGAAGFGQSIDKEDKRTLLDQFNIKTKIFRTSYLYWASLAWTPAYGKWQLPDGDLIYFDTFINAGVGQTALEWRYSEFCETPDERNPDAVAIPADATIAYPTFIGGLGQRYFTSRRTTIRWDIRYHFINYSTADTECEPVEEAGSEIHPNITFSIGMSRFL